MKRCLFAIPVLCGLLFGVSPSAQAEKPVLSFAAIGDVPYGAIEPFDDLIKNINQQAPAFTIHIGDIKTGSSLCTDEYFLQVRDRFNQFEQPLIYTPGDNEWTDCHRANNGAYDPLERLEKIRSIFFANSESLGKQRLSLSAQSEQAEFKRYVENRRWTQAGVLFATIHVVGSNNNWQPELPSVSEFVARDAANIAWLRESFAQAQAQGSMAVVLAMQADTFYGSAGPNSGFTQLLAALQTEISAWGKPVLLIQGDTHDYKLDRPLKNAQGQAMPQVLRIVVPGDRHPNAVLVDIDASHPEQPFKIRLLGTAMH